MFKHTAPLWRYIQTVEFAVQSLRNMNLAVVTLAGDGSEGFLGPEILVANVVALEGVPGNVIA